MKANTRKILTVGLAALVVSASAVEASFRDKVKGAIDSAADFIDEKVVPVASEVIEDGTDFAKKHSKTVGKAAGKVYEKAIKPAFDKAEKGTRHYIQEAIAEHKAKKAAANSTTVVEPELDLEAMVAFCDSLTMKNIGTDEEPAILLYQDGKVHDEISGEGEIAAFYELLAAVESCKKHLPANQKIEL